jgi:hypothetical protein
MAVARREVEIVVQGSVRMGRFRRVPLAAVDGWWGGAIGRRRRKGMVFEAMKASAVRMRVVGRME